MSVDVSPDGSTLLFDLLGDVYTLPISGGKARRLTSGMGWDVQPRFSPDGRSIAFVSDRSGAWKVWIANADGTNLRAITHDTPSQNSANFGLYSPVWMRDGSGVLAARSSSIYLYSIAGDTG